MAARKPVLIYALAVACAGCASPRSPADAMDTSCALDVPHTRVEVRDAPKGTILAFSTDPERVELLRSRVLGLAARQQPSAQSDPMRIAGADAITEIVADGAELILTPRAAHSMKDLRRDARDLATRLRATPCKRPPPGPSMPSLPPSFLIL